MGKKTKTGKNRLDKFYRLAKEQGYRARSAFKLIQLNKKYDFLGSARVVIDLCAAPGSWCQVARNTMPLSTKANTNIIIGIDLVPIKPIPGVIFLQQDITTQKCRQEIRKHLFDWKADVVMHDGAPNVGSSWIQDAFEQNVLVLHSIKIATEFLRKDGVFVTKIFRSKEYNNLIFVLKNLFGSVEATKPKSSRSVSAEIFVVARGFLAPDKIDPKFFDSKHVFRDISDVNPSTGERGLSKTIAENKIFGKKIMKAPAEGYDQEKGLLFRSLPVRDFIAESADPIVYLATYNAITWGPHDEDLKKETNEEVTTMIQDLKVLGKADFKVLLRWRMKLMKMMKAQKKQGDGGDDNENGDEDGDDDDDENDKEEEKDEDEEDDEKLEEELEHLTANERARAKSKLRKQRKIKAKRQRRIDMGMELHQIDHENPTDEALFAMNKIKTQKHLAAVDTNNTANNNRQYDNEDDDDDDDDDSDFSDSADDDSDEDEDERKKRIRAMDKDLENMYEEYVSIKNDVAKKRQKLLVAQMKHKKREDILSAFEDDKKKHNHNDAANDDDDDDDDQNPLIVGRKKTDLDAEASRWFNQDMFDGINENDDEANHRRRFDDDDDNDEDEDDEDDEEDEEDQDDADDIQAMADAHRLKRKHADDQLVNGGRKKIQKLVEKEEEEEQEQEEKDGDIAIDKKPLDVASVIPKSEKDRRALLALGEMMLRKKDKNSLIDASYNKWEREDDVAVPSWFRDDELQHSSRPNNATIMSKREWKELTAKTSKKEAEAKARQKMKTHKKMEAAKSKASTIMESGDLNEKQKFQAIEKLVKKSKEVRHNRIRVIATSSGGASVDISKKGAGTGRRYKLVDKRMKKDMRGMKKAEKRKGKVGKKKGRR